MSIAAKTLPYKHSLSVIIPAYNEEATIHLILEKIVNLKIDRSYEIVVVNDGSKDGTHFVIRNFIKANPQVAITYVSQDNTGKGGAVKTGIMASKYEVILIQDADLEYDPNDYEKILAKIDAGAHVVYGSRNIDRKNPEHSSTLFYWGGLLVTWVANFLYGSRMTDEATCYKAFRKTIFQNIDFYRKDFGWEPEITAKLLKNKITIEEVPISYFPRSKAEGKKITWRDGLIAVWILLYERFRK